jgi:hypothetical protein
MNRIASCLLPLALLGGAQIAQAACIYPPEPSIPDGATATEAQLKAAQGGVKDYMAAVTAYTDCLDSEEKTLGPEATPEQKNLHTAKHNAAVDALNAVAARFNEQLQAYKKAHAK